MSRRPVVIKVGGSLLDWPELRTTLERELEARQAEPLVIVIGGGAVTDVVRDLDQVHTLGQERSHALALRSLDLTAHLLTAIVPTLVVVDRIESLNAVWTESKVPILAPRIFLDEVDARSADPIPHAWEATSDSIAARVAVYLDSPELVLVKSAPLPHGANRRGAAQLGLVDPLFPDSARRLARVFYLNLRDSPPIPILLPP
ncbi:amino acid kinase family protein [Singulisphaera acidiphila]|uniref:Putative kinase, aspartokinase/uridylate kinase n=1 Tax=Singulisphaera acidiphila (strain ATCC BAA-1392 / DSM 18658 / VKM B-2454 / MOB10) TaxID=886293 RepID=L0D868_SINAD|nr:kinase aspartokinase/uridylate kinase [Singulisphaera acidiphila]AGA25604.1 putative kinase, aspartokinase/uridylate kinase [Singulisphaera acidiphila DSM 18658]